MQTNNTTPISTVYTVITYAVFGSVQTTEAFYVKEDAEQCVLDWANKNSDETFSSCDEALDWFSANEEDVDVSVQLEETLVYGNKAYCDEDLEMLASENMFMGEFLSKLGYSHEQVSEIANTGMLEKEEKEVTTVIGLQNGIVDEAKSFVSYKDAKAHFVKEVKKLDPEISDDDIGACLDNGYWDNNSGIDIFIVSNELVPFAKMPVKCDCISENRIITIEDEFPWFTISDAKALIGENVDVLDNDETQAFNGLVINAEENDVDGILITVLDQDDQAWDLSPRHIVRTDDSASKEEKYLSAVYPKVGMQVCVGGYDDNASAGQQRFVDEHYGQLFEVLEVGEYSSKLKNVPFRVKHAHVYEIVKQGEGE